MKSSEDASRSSANERNQPRRNATGPKTVQGKRRVRYNALQHGFFSKHLVVTESEKQEFEAIRASLLAELEPMTALETVAFERLLCASWRVRQALRMEQVAVTPELTLEVSEQEKNGADATNVIAEPPRWYTSGRAATLRAMKGLEELRAELVENAGLHLEEHKDWIVKTCGPEFYESLTKWRPENKEVILLAEQLTQHAQKFKIPLPNALASNDRTKVVVDQHAKWDMMIKLVDVKLQDLNEIYRMRSSGIDESNSGERAIRSDSISRYITSAVRELERAFEWYRHIAAHPTGKLIGSTPLDTGTKLP